MGKKQAKGGGTPKRTSAVANGRTPKKSKKDESANSSSFAYSWKVAALSGLALALVVPLVSWLTKPTPPPSPLDFRGKSLDDLHFQLLTRDEVPESQQWPLKKPYTVDLQKLLREREENMKKYNFNYNRFGVDKRSNLSLQEYFDVYDGKW